MATARGPPNHHEKTEGGAFLLPRFLSCSAGVAKLANAPALGAGRMPPVKSKHPCEFDPRRPHQQFTHIAFFLSRRNLFT